VASGTDNFGVLTRSLLSTYPPSTMKASNKTMKRTGMAILYGGYFAVVVLLFVSGLQALRLQSFGSDQQAKAQEQFAAREKVLIPIRKSIGAPLTAAREFVLSDWPDGVTTFRLARSKPVADGEEALDQLARQKAWIADVIASTDSHDPIAYLRAKLQEYWDLMRDAEDREQWQQAPHGREHLMAELTQRQHEAQAALKVFADTNQETRDSALEGIAGERRNLEHVLLTFIGIGFVLILVVAAFNLAYARDLEYQRRAKYEEVTKAKDDLGKLSVRLLNIQEEERKRLSRELHDGIGQILTALRIEISRAQSQNADVKRARELAEDAVRTIRDISLLLRPTLLDDLGLDPALRWHAEEFSRRTGIACEFVVDGLGMLPEDWNTCVYRVVQEAIHNCEKHAAPTRVRISIRQQPGQLSVDVEDNGRGFDAASRPGGLGILGMRERAAMLGGTLDVGSALGRGTKVTLRLPLAQISTAKRETTLPRLPATTEKSMDVHA
jgi:signal transduction histidine kinase